MEAELEAQLEQAEMKTKELKAMSNRLQLENEQLRDKLEQCSREYHYQVWMSNHISCFLLIYFLHFRSMNSRQNYRK